MQKKKDKHTVEEVAAGALTSIAAWILRVATPVFVAILIYWAFIIFTGQIKVATDTGVAVLRNMGHLLVLSGFLAAASLALLTAEDITLTIVIAAVGLTLFLGLPALVVGRVGTELQAAQVLLGLGKLAGEAILGVAVVRIAYEIYRSSLEGEARKERKAREDHELGRKTALKPPSESVLARCWEMPFCHQAVREMCPAFKAKKSCWRFGRGCNCDADLIDTLVLNRNPGPSRQAREVEAEYIRTDLEADKVRSRSERTIPCTKCPIFAEHQRRKFKVINPIIILITIGALFFFYGPLTEFYSLLAAKMAQLMSGSLLNPSASSNVSYWQAYLDNAGLKASFVVIVGLFVLSWMLKLGEWLVLEKKVL